MKEIWDNYVEHSFGEQEQAIFKFKQFENNYRKYFPKDKNVPVLDVGVGRGEMLSCMKAWGYVNYQGVDISSSTVDFCKSLKLPCLLVDDVRIWLRQHGNYFGTITLLDVLEHIKKEEVLSYLQELRNGLLPGGVLLIQVPNAQASDSNLHFFNDITHQTVYTEHSFKQVLLAAGFNNISFYGFEETTSKGLRRLVKIGLRSLLWRWVRFSRAINGNLNPDILNPVFFAVARKE